MVFSSYAFLCFLLPVVLILNIAVRNVRFRNGLLLVASLLFYAYGEPVYIILLIISILMNYLFGLMVTRKRGKTILAIAVVCNIGLLFVFKYLGFVLGTIDSLTGGGLPFSIPGIRLPIGISFYTFQALSYVIDVFRGDCEPQRNVFRLMLYVSFFPQLIAGPIIKYHDVDEQIEDREVTAEDLRAGMLRFSFGLGKKILIANVMAEAADALFAVSGASMGALAAWVAAIAYVLQIYFDFSGYSDMALGLGRMFGFHFPENFDHPYIAESVKDFWRRWHISLSSWFKEYVYIPLGGNRKGRVRTILNRYIVFILTGIWHGANWTFLLWGLWHGTFLVIEGRGMAPTKSFLRKMIRHIYTLLEVTLGFVLFRADTIGQAWNVIKAMFGFGGFAGTAYTTALSFLAPYYLLVFGIAVAGSTDIAGKIAALLMRRRRTAGMVTAMSASLLILVLCFLQLASNSYNPFIYFRF